MKERSTAKLWWNIIMHIQMLLNLSYVHISMDKCLYHVYEDRDMNWFTGTWIDWLSVSWCWRDWTVWHMDLTLGTGMNLKVNVIGQRSMYAIVKTQFFGNFRWGGICRFTFSLHMMSCDIMVWRHDVTSVAASGQFMWWSGVFRPAYPYNVTPRRDITKCHETRDIRRAFSLP